MIGGLTYRLIGLIVAALLLVAALVWGPAAWRSMKTAKKEAEIAKGQAGAAIDAGAEATNTLGNVIDLSRETDQAVKEGADAIRSSDEAGRGDAAVAASCKLRAYRNSERCARLRAANPGQP